MTRAAEGVYKTPVLQRQVLFPSSSIHREGVTSGAETVRRGPDTRFSADGERIELFGKNDAYRRRFSIGLRNGTGFSDDEVEDDAGCEEICVEPDDKLCVITESYQERVGNAATEEVGEKSYDAKGHFAISDLEDEHSEGCSIPVHVKLEEINMDSYDYYDNANGGANSGKVELDNVLWDNESDGPSIGCTVDGKEERMGQNDEGVTQDKTKSSCDAFPTRKIKIEQRNKLDGLNAKEADKRKRPRMNEVLRLQKSLETARWTNAKAVREQSEVIIISDDESLNASNEDSGQRIKSRRKRRKRMCDSQAKKEEAKDRSEGELANRGRVTVHGQTRAKKDEWEDVSSGDEVETKMTGDEWEALLQGWVIECEVERDGIRDLDAEKVKSMICGPFGLGERADELLGEPNERKVRRVGRRRLSKRNVSSVNLDAERTDSEGLSNEDIRRKASLRRK